MFSKALTFVCLVALSQQQEIGFGGCPKVTFQQSFDVNAYLGDWYEIVKFPAIFELGQTCAKAHYELMSDGHINITNSGYGLFGQPIVAHGEAKMMSTDGSAQLKLRFSASQPWGDYWVLDTDYKTYTLIYSCGNVLGGAGHVEFAWILSRQRTLAPEIKKRLYDEMTRFDINTKHFITMDQTNCD